MKIMRNCSAIWHDYVKKKKSVYWRLFPLDYVKASNEQHIVDDEKSSCWDDDLWSMRLAALLSRPLWHSMGLFRVDLTIRFHHNTRPRREQKFLFYYFSVFNRKYNFMGHDVLALSDDWSPSHRSSSSSFTFGEEAIIISSERWWERGGVCAAAMTKKNLWKFIISSLYCCAVSDVDRPWTSWERLSISQKKNWSWGESKIGKREYFSQKKKYIRRSWLEQ